MFRPTSLWSSGFPQGLFERGVQKGWGVWGSSPKEKKSQSFKFECMKWPILAEITAKSAIYSHFLCQQGGGGISPPCGAERGGGSRPPPLAETLVIDYNPE